MSHWKECGHEVSGGESECLYCQIEELEALTTRLEEDRDDWRARCEAFHQPWLYVEEIKELQVERDLLIKWFKWTMWTEGDWSGNIDGGDLQDQAEKMGLIKMVTQEKPCRDDGCMCAEVCGTDEFPVECFVYADWLKEESENETIHTYDPDSHDSTVQRHGTG